MHADDGADSVKTVAVYLGLLDADFTVSKPPELVERLRKLADRYHRACTTAATWPRRAPSLGEAEAPGSERFPIKQRDLTQARHPGAQRRMRSQINPICAAAASGTPG